MVKTQLTSNIYLCHSYLNWYLFKWHQEFNHVYMWQRNISLLCFLFMFGVDDLWLWVERSINSPHMLWWRGPWRRYSIAGSTVLLTAVQQTPGAPAQKHTLICSFAQPAVWFQLQNCLVTVWVYVYVCWHVCCICFVLGAIPCLPPLRAERKWSAETCWTRNGEIGRRWLNPTSEECQWEAEGTGGSRRSQSFTRIHPDMWDMVHFHHYSTHNLWDEM